MNDHQLDHEPVRLPPVRAGTYSLAVAQLVQSRGSRAAVVQMRAHGDIASIDSRGKRPNEPQGKGKGKGKRNLARLSPVRAPRADRSKIAGGTEDRQKIESPHPRESKSAAVLPGPG